MSRRETSRAAAGDDASTAAHTLESQGSTGLDPRPPSAPRRTCVGCRGRDSRSVLLRLVVEKDDRGMPAAVPDPRRRLPGRGAWLHPEIVCLDKAVRAKALPRALRVQGPLSVDAVRAHLEALAPADTPDVPPTRTVRRFETR